MRRWITDRVVDFLTRPLARYERHGANDLGALKRSIRKGDVLLVQGDQRVSAIIRYLTQSCWSHSALYIGDEILRRDGDLAARARAEFGEEAQCMIVEALPQGVVAAPLCKYVDYNIRICRPHRLRPDDLKLILDDALGAVGWRYDLKNVLDLAWHFLPAEMIPRRFRPRAPRFGSATDTEVICSSLLGELFSRVRFPVVPSVHFPDGEPLVVPEPRPGWLARMVPRKHAVYPGVFRRRHPSSLAPRDFDLSPYFEIVKFNVIQEGDFDYQRIRWLEESEEH